MKLAQVENGVVLNIIDVNPKAIPPEMADWPKATAAAKIGGGYDGKFSAPPEPDPAEVLERERAGMVASRFQAKAALMQAGKLADVEAAVAAGDAMTQLAWAEAVELRRTSPMIEALAAVVGLSETEVDDLFRAAMEIEA